MNIFEFINERKIQRDFSTDFPTQKRPGVKIRILSSLLIREWSLSNAQIQIKMPFFCNYFRWMWGSIEFFMLIILTKVIFAKNRFLYPKNRFFEKIDPKGRLKYSSRDGGTKNFFIGYESSRWDLTVDEKLRRFHDYRTSYRLRKFDSKNTKNEL